LDMLLETQAEITQTNSTFAKKHTEKLQENLNGRLTDEELQDILDKQIQVSKLLVQLENLQEEKLEVIIDPARNLN